MDHSGLNAASSSRTASRSRRLIRFRTTAFPKALGVVNPTRRIRLDSSPLQTEGSEKGTRIACPLFVNLSEIAGSKEPDTFGKA